MLKRVAAVLLAILAPGFVSAAIGESMFQGVYDFMLNAFAISMKDAIRLIALNMAAKPDLAMWPTMSAIHDSFAWISGFFMVVLTYQGVRYVMSADSPGGRANAKVAVQRMIVGMVIVSMNSLVFDFGLDFSAALTNAFVGTVDAQEPVLAKLLALETVSLACILTPLGLLCVLLLLLMYLARFMVLILVWAFFPLILALYFSQIGYLARLGQRGVNLFICAIVAGPIMGFLFRVSYDMLIGACSSVGSQGVAQVNGIEPFVALFMSLVGFLLAGLSPILTLGLFEEAAAVAGVATAVAGTFLGGTAGAAFGASAGGFVASASSGLKDAVGNVAGQGQPNAKNDIREAGEKADELIRMAAVKTAASGVYDASQEGRARYMSDVYVALQENGLVREDCEGRIQVGDAGKALDRRHPELLRDYSEWTAPYGRGFGDEKSRRIAYERGLMSDGRLVVKNAAQGRISFRGQSYDIAANDGGDGLFNVVVQGPMSNTALTVRKGGQLNSKEDVIRMVREASQETDQTPAKVLRLMNEGG